MLPTNHMAVAAQRRSDMVHNPCRRFQTTGASCKCLILWQSLINPQELQAIPLVLKNKIIASLKHCKVPSMTEPFLLTTFGQKEVNWVGFGLGSTHWVEAWERSYVSYNMIQTSKKATDEH